MTVTETETTIIEQLRKHAVAAAKSAYAPYSDFQVGAAIYSLSGKIFGGCNIENSSYGATVCAERVAIWQAVAAGERSFSHLYVYSLNGWPPCGLCRQVMAEFFLPKGMVIMGDAQGKELVITVDKLFPLAFTPDKLDNKS